MGIEGAQWLLIRPLHEEAAAAVKWGGPTSDPLEYYRDWGKEKCWALIYGID